MENWNYTLMKGYLLLGIFLIALSSVRGQTLKYVDRGNRFEGAYNSPIATDKDLSLVGMTGSNIWHEPNQRGQILNIYYFLPNGFQESELRTTVCEKEIFHGYEMRPKYKYIHHTLGWNTFKDWKVDAVLVHLGIPGTNLTSLTELTSPNQTLILPSFIYNGGNSRETSPNKGKYYFTFHTEQNCRKGLLSIYEALLHGTGKLEGDLNKLVCIKSIGAVSDDDRFFASVKFNQPEGWYHVILKMYHSRDSDKDYCKFFFYHKP